MSDLTSLSCTVRLGTAEDATDILAILKESMTAYRLATAIPAENLVASSESVEDILHAIEVMPVLVAVSPDGKIAGSVRLETKRISDFEMPSLRTQLKMAPMDLVGYFTRFSVAKPMQNSGIGNLLLLSALSKAQELALPYVFLHTASNNEKLVAFYQKRGFEMLMVNTDKGYPRGLFAKKIGTES